MSLPIDLRLDYFLQPSPAWTTSVLILARPALFVTSSALFERSKPLQRESDNQLYTLGWLCVGAAYSSAAQPIVMCVCVYKSPFFNILIYIHRHAPVNDTQHAPRNIVQFIHGSCWVVAAFPLDNPDNSSTPYISSFHLRLLLTSIYSYLSLLTRH